MTGDLGALAACVHDINGLVVGDAQLDSLRAALARVAPGLTPASVLSDPDPRTRERLADQMANKETFFLRNMPELDGLDWNAKAARATAAGDALRIWSVGCSSGEEAYSLALLAAEAIGAGPPPIDVLGTDLSTSVLALAERGRYGARSLRLLDGERRRRWFVADGAGLHVGPELRRRVRFARHNVIHDPFPPAGEAPFDLVVCRNVLIYFDAPTVVHVRDGLLQALAPEGQLLLGTIDRLSSRPAFAAARRGPRGVEAARGARSATESPAQAAQAAFEAGSRALSFGNGPAAVSALRRALDLDPRRAVIALQLARALEAVDDLAAARQSYRQALDLAGRAHDPAERLYDHIAAGDVAATCRARLAVLGTQ